MEQISNLISGLTKGQSDSFTQGIANVLTKKAQDMVNDYRSVAFNEYQPNLEEDDRD